MRCATRATGRLNVSSYPAFFLINGGQHEPFSVHSAEEMAAFVSAKVRGKDPDREIRKVLLKIRPMLYREDTPPEEVLDLEPEAFDETARASQEAFRGPGRALVGALWSLKPEYRRASREVKSPNIRFAAVNSRAFPDLAERFGVSSYPWVISIYAGRSLGKTACVGDERRGEDMTGLGGAESLVRFAREQHQKLYSGSPSWAEEWPRWPAQDSLSSLAEPSNSSGGTWRELLGRSTWFLLHSMAARYPETPSKADQVALQGLFASLGQHFPCPICRTHLREKLLSLPLAHHNRTELTKLCQLHNMVNKDLHKAQHSCNSFELDLQYLKSCGECTQVHIEEEDEVAAPGHWNYFQYMEMAPAEARRHELCGTSATSAESTRMAQPETNANLSEMLAKLKMHREQFHKLKQEVEALMGNTGESNALENNLANVTLINVEEKTEEVESPLEEEKLHIAFYEFDQSMWDASLLLCFHRTSIIDKVLLFVGVSINLTLQVSLLLVVYMNLLDNPYPNEKVQEMITWRVSNGHSSFDEDSGKSIVMRLCSRELWSYEQDQYDEMFDYLYKPVPGVILSALAIILWVLTIMVEYRHCIEQYLGVLHLPRLTAQDGPGACESNERVDGGLVSL
eukprot:g26047.t1